MLRRQAIDAGLATLRGRCSEPEGIEALLPQFRVDAAHEEEPQSRGTSDRLRSDAGPSRQVVRGCIDRLPEPHRVVLVLSDGEGLAPRSIARGLAISEERVKRTLHEARLALRTLLAPFLRAGTRVASRGELADDKRSGRWHRE